MYEKLTGVEERLIELETAMADPKVVSDRESYEKCSREHADLSRIVTPFREYKKALADIEDSNELLQDKDPDIRELARQDLRKLNEEKERLEQELKQLLLPVDPNDDKNVILEIRAGTGGEEAALFAGDLYRMYSRYAENRRWKVEAMDHHATDGGGFKEIISMIHGRGAYSRLKYESGIHRVQRVPETEAQGRIHTSAVTVAVLPEADEVEVNIDPVDLKIDVYRASGPGGQHVNKTESAVRITHLPTGLVVTCQDEKSQLKNRNKAMKVLQARLFDRMIREQNEKISEERKSQVGTGDRSGRIRTYNFPQGRVTDHRIGLTLYKLEAVLQGELDEVIDELITYYQAQAMQHDEIPADA
jgi:peptide chain release factor 1